MEDQVLQSRGINLTLLWSIKVRLQVRKSFLLQDTTEGIIIVEEEVLAKHSIVVGEEKKGNLTINQKNQLGE